MADPENVPMLNAAMNDIRKRIRALESDLAQSCEVGDYETIATDIVGKAKTLFRALMDSSNDALKPVLSQLVQKVEMKFGDGLWGKRRIRVVTGCDAYLFANFSFTTVSRGDWRWTFPNDLDSRALMLAAISASVNFDREEFFSIAAL